MMEPVLMIGACQGANGAANRAAIQAVIDHANGGPVTIDLPAGVIELDFTGVNAITFAQNLVITGAGRGHTVLDVYPKTVTNVSFFCFLTATKDLVVEMSDFDVIGPMDSLAAYNTGKGTGMSSGFFRLMPQSGALAYGTQNHQAFRRIRISGQFTAGIETWCGDGKMMLEDCDVSAMNACVTAFTMTDTFRDRRVHIEKCRFSGGMLASETWDQSAHGDLVYMHPAVSVRVSASDFLIRGIAGVHHYSGGSSGAAKCAIIDGCRFEHVSGTTSGAPIVTGGEDFVTQISNCSFEYGHIAVRSSVNISDCSFRHAAILAQAPITKNVPVSAKIHGCRFLVDTGLPYAATTISTGKNWTTVVSDCEIVFDATPQKTFAIGISCSTGSSSSPERTIVSGCTFRGLASNDSDAPNLTAISVGTANGLDRLTVDDCDFSGRITFCVRTPQVTTSSLMLTGNRFMMGFDDLGLNRLAVHPDFSSPATGAIYGNGNYFAAGVGVTRTADAQSVAIGKGQASVPVASASTIWLDVNHDTFMMTGTAMISTIHLGVNPYATEVCHTGILRLIAAGAFTLGANGNVLPNTMMSRRVNEMIELVYVASLAKWIEV